MEGTPPSGVPSDLSALVQLTTASMCSSSYLAPPGAPSISIRDKWSMNGMSYWRRAPRTERLGPDHSCVHVRLIMSGAPGHHQLRDAMEHNMSMSLAACHPT